MLEHPRFRAAYDFLLLREAAGEQTDGLGDWWTRYKDASEQKRREMIRELSDGPDSSAKRPRNRRKRKPRAQAD
jgi:poly(A) polymerase